MKKLISWNVNGIRACVKKGFLESFRDLDADVFALQETKMQEGQLELALPGYFQYWNYAERKGYAGTAVFTKEEPLRVFYGLDCPELDTEGRVITLEFPTYFFVTAYVPNAQEELKRIAFRLRFEDKLREYLCSLAKEKPVTYCGDLNVAHREIDLKNPKPNIGHPGFSDEERGKFTELLASGFTDSFRFKYPDVTDAYSWWSYRARAGKTTSGGGLTTLSSLIPPKN